MAVVFQGIEGAKKGRMVIGCASVLRLGHGNTKTLLSFFPNNIGAKHFLRAKTLNSSNLTSWPVATPSSPASVPTDHAPEEALRWLRLGGQELLASLATSS